MNNKICLNMVVKNEAHIVKRALLSVASFISYYVIILDSLCTDNSREVIEQTMISLGIPGEIHVQEWRGFKQTRQHLLNISIDSPNRDYDWIFMLDADDEVIIQDPFFFSSLDDNNSYLIEKRFNDIHYWFINLININKHKWEWRHILNSVLVPVQGSPLQTKLKGMWVKYTNNEGARSIGKDSNAKYLYNIKLIDRQYGDNIDSMSPRDMYYYARSYENMKMYDQALELYGKRISMNGFDEETYMAQYKIACLHEELGHESDVVIREYLKAYNLRKIRAEPLWKLSMYCRNKELHEQALRYSTIGINIKIPNDVLFVRMSVYQWSMMYEHALACINCVLLDRAIATLKSLLQSKDCPMEIKMRCKQLMSAYSN